MSLVSTRSFIAPLLDKRNLITIILVAIFFGVFRWAGGGVSTDSASVEKRSGSTSATQEAPLNPSLFDTAGDDFSPSDPRDVAKDLSHSKGAKARPKADIGNPDVLEMISPKQREAVHPKESESSESLDEIERSLGLR